MRRRLDYAIQSNSLWFKSILAYRIAIAILVLWMIHDSRAGTQSIGMFRRRLAFICRRNSWMLLE